MKTSSISLRVADFLKQYPPFEFLGLQDLVQLAGTGRVKFHEEGEHVFDEGEPRGRHFYVIQQGTVNLYTRSAKGGEDLVDVRVEGDLLGIFWLMGEQPYRYTAITASDTLLYALPFEDFLPLVARYPAATRYLVDYFSEMPVGKGEDADGSAHGSGQGLWLQKAGIHQTFEPEDFLTCAPGEQVKEVAKKLSRHHQQAAVVTNPQSCPIGIVTEADLCRRVATGQISPEAPVESLMTSPVRTVGPDLDTGQLLLRMLRHRLRHLCVTQDGTPATPVVGLISERELQMKFGRLPNALGRQILAASDVRALSRLRDRADQLLVEYLESEADMRFLIDFVAEIDGLVLNRALAMAEQILLDRGLEKPDIDFCWLAMHSEGRKERLIRSSQRTALVYADPPVEISRYCRRWFLHLAEEVSHILVGCRFPFDTNGRLASNTEWCQPYTTWKAYYSRWIHEPIESNIVTLTTFFDLRAVGGNPELAEGLRRHIQAEIKESPNFIPLLANDAMANLPPVTIFRDSVMDKAGILWSCIDTKMHALYPLVDVARVFALEYELEDCTNTMERFERMAEVLPEERELFRAASEAVRASLALQSLIGHHRGDNGQFIRPHELTKSDQEHLKGVFRTIVRLLDFAAAHFKLKQD
jgi:CBS domain-containing protein